MASLPTRHTQFRKEFFHIKNSIPFCFSLGHHNRKSTRHDLDIGVVAIGKKAASPGIAFTALTRFRHPDDFALDDCFPDVSTILRQRDTKSFQKRLKWEKHMRVLFSRTLRRHFRDATLYNPDMVWNDLESTIADKILRHVRSNGISEMADMCTALQNNHSDITAENFKIVWERLQKWPHVCELDAANVRNTASTQTNLQHMSSPPKLPLSKISVKGYYVYIDEWRNLLNHGLLTLSSFEFLAKIFRPHLPPNIVLYAAGILSTAKPSLTKTKIVSLPRLHKGSIQTRVYPYLFKSKHTDTKLMHCYQNRFRQKLSIG